jgi:hypothetical protein
MKKLIVIGLLLLSVNVFSQDKNICKTNLKYQGVAIFIESEPVKEYEIINYERHRIKWFPNPGKDLERIVKKIKKRYPAAEGIIFRLNKKRRCDIIKFIE